MSEEFLTIPEVAALLRIGQRTAYELARQGMLQGAVKVGNQWRVARAALDAWVHEKGNETMTKLSQAIVAEEGRP